MRKSQGIKGKLSQWVMIGLFPTIAIGSLFYPLLGYLTPGMVVFPGTLSYIQKSLLVRQLVFQGCISGHCVIRLHPQPSLTPTVQP